MVPRGLVATLMWSDSVVFFLTRPSLSTGINFDVPVSINVPVSTNVPEFSFVSVTEDDARVENHPGSTVQYVCAFILNTLFRVSHLSYKIVQ
jgi:hypothetical protein